MKRYILLSFLAAIFAFACGGGAEKPLQTTGSKKVAKAVDGAKVYKMYCVVCHGTKGDMGSNGAFNLTTSILNVDARKSVIKKGRGVMTPFEGVLTEEEVTAVAEYTMTLTKK